MGIETSEMEVDRRDLAEINGAFLCSTLMEIRAISQLGQRVVPTAELPVYKSLVTAFRALTHQ
jgi:branched-subunit amino acid aminotransferase/4-amino-4-deoxychorismate lyase